jgi:hypothetical protein
MSGDESPRRPLDGILDGLGDSIANETPEELLNEARSAGRDTEAIAKSVRAALETSVKKFEQRELDAARDEYRRRCSARPDLPQRFGLSADERRRTLAAILKRAPEIDAALTAQHRNYETLSDEDVSSALGDLEELGFLDDQDSLT